MREPIRDKNRLEHIIEAIDTILNRTKDMEFDELTADKLLYGGIVYNTMIIGEASYKLSKAFVVAHPQIAWQDIQDMRHHLVHGYYQVDASIIWDVIQNDLAPLRQQVAHLLETIDWDEWSKVENGNIGITGN